MTTPNSALQIGFMIGGGGSTLLNVFDHIERGDLPAAIPLVISSREKAAGVGRARQRGLHVQVINAESAGSQQAADTEIARKFQDAGVELICMGGYMRLFEVPIAFHNRVMNVHPALLPAFGGKGMYGKRVHQAVIDHGCKVSGCTVHFVDGQYDNGPIIVQKTCPVTEHETAESLARKVGELERLAYPEAIRLFAKKRITVDGRRARIV